MELITNTTNIKIYQSFEFLIILKLLFFGHGVQAISGTEMSSVSSKHTREGMLMEFQAHVLVEDRG